MITTVLKTGQPCVACSGALKFFGNRGTYAYGVCESCGTIQLAPFPTAAELDRAYADDYATSGHYGTDPERIYSASRPFYAAVLDTLRARVAAPAAVLDFGCGWGGMCRELAGAGYDALGLDYPSESLNHCRSLGLTVTDMPLEAMVQRDERFSAILMVTVLEHLHDHAETLARLRGLLVPGGVIIVLIPTAHLFGPLAAAIRRLRRSSEIPALNTTFCPPWHTAIVSLRGMQHLARRAGLEVMQVRAAPSGAGRGLIGPRWPLVLNHIFVLGHEAANATSTVGNR